LAHWPAAAPLRLGVVGASARPATDRLNGVTLGVEEAQHGAEMFGGSVVVVPVEGASSALANLSAILGDADEARCVSLSRQADAAGIPFVNIACASDRLRGADCHASTFHVAAGDAMARAAVAMAHGGEARVWDPSLKKFGADTLNQRFERRFAAPMTSDAWAGWFAVKALWESSLRARSVEPRKLVAYLARETTQFDGHKGRPLSFRSWDGQLRQPLYVRTSQALVEVPDATGADESTEEVLDRLGTSAAQSACRARR
jgi:ABC-type branched-subunit amino acid transport system substrate-binding protein